MVFYEGRTKISSNGTTQKQIDDPHDDCSHWCGKI